MVLTSTISTVKKWVTLLLLFVILVVFPRVIEYKGGGMAVPPPVPYCSADSGYSKVTYTIISDLVAKGYTLPQILTTFDSLGFVQNSRTQSIRLDIETAYIDALAGGLYGEKRMEECPD